MSFTVLFIAHAPDADPEKHRAEIVTGQYRLISVVVRDQAEAVAAALHLAAGEGIDTVLLCPGFTHADVAEIQRELGGAVGVAVARGDGPSNTLSSKARARESHH